MIAQIVVAYVVASALVQSLCCIVVLMVGILIGVVWAEQKQR